MAKRPASTVIHWKGRNYSFGFLQASPMDMMRLQMQLTCHGFTVIHCHELDDDLWGLLLRR